MIYLVALQCLASNLKDVYFFRVCSECCLHLHPVATVAEWFDLYTTEQRSHRARSVPVCVTVGVATASGRCGVEIETNLNTQRQTCEYR